MDVQSLHAASLQQPLPHPSDGVQKQLQQGQQLQRPDDAAGGSPELREAFTDFVGQTLFGSMLASMRKTVGKPAYMHGGRTEEVFQQQLDQKIVEDLTESSADQIAGPMFDLFQMQRKA